MTDALQLTLRHPPTPKAPALPEEKRDEVLDAHERFRRQVLDLARPVAMRICEETGRVTSTDVIAALRKAGHGPLLDSIDLRAIGAVFRSGKGWRRIGMSNVGSHRRACAVWTRGETQAHRVQRARDEVLVAARAWALARCYPNPARSHDEDHRAADLCAALDALDTVLAQTTERP